MNCRLSLRRVRQRTTTPPLASSSLFDPLFSLPRLNSRSLVKSGRPARRRRPWSTASDASSLPSSLISTRSNLRPNPLLHLYLDRRRFLRRTLPLLLKHVWAADRSAASPRSLASLNLHSPRLSCLHLLLLPSHPANVKPRRPYCSVRTKTPVLLACLPLILVAQSRERPVRTSNGPRSSRGM